MVRIVAMVFFGLPVTFAIAMEKTVTSFLAFSFTLFLCFGAVKIPCRLIGEIRETIFMGLRRSQNDCKKRYKMQMSIIVMKTEAPDALDSGRYQISAPPAS